MDKLRRIFPLLMVYVLIISLNIVFFAYLYDINNSIIDPTTENIVSKRDILYFSGITYLTIGYGDFVTANGIGQFLAVLQGFSGVLINSVFTGLFLYYLVKRPKNIVLSDNIYIMYKEAQNKFYLSIRIGNKGRPLVSVNRILELFIDEDNVYTRKYQFSQEYHYFEKILNWEIDLHRDEQEVLSNYLKSAIVNEKNIFIRISILGTDADAGELVFSSKNYENHKVTFIRSYHNLYKGNLEKVKIKWNELDDVLELDSEKVQFFIKQSK